MSKECENLLIEKLGDLYGAIGSASVLHLTPARRRDRIATACLAGLLGDAETRGLSYETFAKDAIKFADALIAELDQPKE